MQQFARATAIRALDEGRFASEIIDGWDIGGNANGGYLMAVAARAMGASVGRPPLSLTAHFLAPGPTGPASAGNSWRGRFPPGTSLPSRSIKSTTPTT